MKITKTEFKERASVQGFLREFPDKTLDDTYRRYLKDHVPNDVELFINESSIEIMQEGE